MTQGVVVDELSIGVLALVALVTTENGVEEEAEGDALVAEGIQHTHAHCWIGAADDAAVVLVDLAVVVDVHDAVVAWVISVGDVVAHLVDAVNGVVVDGRKRFADEE